jgi:hypothetical protein
MNIFTLNNKIKLWIKLNPDIKNSCRICGLKQEYYSTATCDDLKRIFRTKYKLQKTEQICGLCPVPFMYKEDHE